MPVLIAFASLRYSYVLHEFAASRMLLNSAVGLSLNVLILSKVCFVLVLGGSGACAFLTAVDFFVLAATTFAEVDDEGRGVGI